MNQSKLLLIHQVYIFLFADFSFNIPVFMETIIDNSSLYLVSNDWIFGSLLESQSILRQKFVCLESYWITSIHKTV